MKDIIKKLIALEGMDDEYFYMKNKIEIIPETLKKLSDELNNSKLVFEEANENFKKLQAKEELHSKELDEFDQKTKELEKKLYTLKTLKEVDALEESKKHILEEKSKKETEQIELMEEKEKLEKNIPVLKEELEKKESEYNSKKSELDNELKETETKLKELEGRREELKKDIPDNIFKRYEKIFEVREGKALAEVEDNSSCGVCGKKLTPQSVSDALACKKLVECAGCSRILYSEKAIAE